MDKKVDKNDHRITDIADLIMAGCSRRDIHKWVANQGKTNPEWQIERSTIDRITRKAHDYIDKAANLNRDHELALSLVRLDLLFQKSFLITDYKACLAIERERIALLGLSSAGARGPKAASSETLKLRGSWRAKINEEKEKNKSRFFRTASG
jgi:hypothetical protein